MMNYWLLGLWIATVIAGFSIYDDYAYRKWRNMSELTIHVEKLILALPFLLLALPMFRHAMFAVNTVQL